MSRDRANGSGWQGVYLIIITYVYFLIFAQFAFLQRLAELGIADQHLKAVMGVMALGGITLSLLAPRTTLVSSPTLRLRIGLALCGVAAFLSVLHLDFLMSIGVSALIGSGLGLLTVTLVTYLPIWLGSGNLLLKVGLGTGIAYLLCNVPPFFAASSEIQAATSALLCVVGIVITLKHAVYRDAPVPATSRSAVPFLGVLACFTALIWLDSAAFFIIQSSPALKAGTWTGANHLWANGLLHFVAALASSWLLRRKGFYSVLLLAYLALAAACLLLRQVNLVLLASLLYPVGVSLYSVALVAYPSLLATASSEPERGRKAGWIYAIAGWIGSALGIGMGQNLGSVPLAFVLFAGAVISLPILTAVFRRRARELSSVAALLVLAFIINKAIVGVDRNKSPVSPSERGRQVYISEGCINCHSQYVRPTTGDVLISGPVQSIAELRLERPPLIGNRRQGPDLSQVGARRSALWLKMHLLNPTEVSHYSFMPSYAYLFHDSRGNDLVSYLQSLGSLNTRQHVSLEKTWSPSLHAGATADPGEGGKLFLAYCATCHTSTGQTVLRWHSDFRRVPPDLRIGPFLHLAPSDSPGDRAISIARIIKFGIPGTDMPGHEYMDDKNIASLSDMLARNSYVLSGSYLKDKE